MTRNVSEQLSPDSSGRNVSSLLAVAVHHAWLFSPAAMILFILILTAFLPNDRIFEPRWLLPILNTVFLTLMPLLVAILSARSFLNDHSPALLLFSCSMLILGAGSPIAGLMTVSVDVNMALQVWNISTLLVAICSFAAALQIFLDPARRLAVPKYWLIAGYTLSVAVVALIVLASAGGHLPTFFINGQGATPIRHSILYMAIGLLAITFSLIFIRGLQTQSLFLQLYAIGLGMIAAGLAGTWTLRQIGTMQNWGARFCMYVGGAYLFAAGLSALRQARWSIPINILHETHLRYERLVAFCPDSIMVHVDGKYVFANAATAQLLNLKSADEMVGKSVMDHIHPDSRDMIRERISKVLESNAPAPLSEVHLLRSDGTTAEVETIAVRVEYEGRPAVIVVARDIAARKRAEEARRQFEQRYRLLFEGMSEGFAIHEVILDDAGKPVDYRFIDINPSFERLTGLKREFVVGRTMREVLPDDDKSWIDIFGRVALTGEPVHFERHSPALGRHYEVVAYRPAPMQFAVLFMDVSDRKRMENEMLNAREAAERANRAKDEFLARLSHELRTPLTPVLLTASLLERRTDLPPDLHQDITTIRQNVLLEARLIDDLLDLTRIAKGKIQFDFQNVDMHAIARNTVAICSSGTGTPLQMNLRATRTLVHADSARMQQVLWNLLNNARKFTPAEGSIVLATSNPTPEILRLTVTDTGCGIADDFLPRVFNAFEQAANISAPGLGLGLAIAKAIVEAHGGSIAAASAGQGQGSQFTVDLHCLESTAVESAGCNHAPAPAAGEHKPLNLLLVEDHPSTRQVMQKLLTMLGHHVVAVETVQAALAAAEDTHFDFVISDIGLPDGNGHDLMIQLRARHHIHGIALSGYGMEEDKQRSLAAGFIAHLTKPVSLDQLQAVLREVIS